MLTCMQKKGICIRRDVDCDDERDHMDLFTFFAGSIKTDFDIGNK